jgi:hypothetical protein
MEQALFQMEAGLAAAQEWLVQASVDQKSLDAVSTIRRCERAQARVARNEHDIEEEAKFLLLAEALEGKAAKHPDKSVQKLPESRG